MVNRVWPDWEWSVLEENEANASGTAEAVVVLVDPEQLKGEGQAIVHPALDEALRDMFRRGAFGAEPGETAKLPTLGALPERYAVFAAVEAPPYTAKSLRLAAAGAGRALAELSVRSAAIRAPKGLRGALAVRGLGAAAAALASGLALGAYARLAWRSDSAAAAQAARPGGTPPLADVRVILPAGEDNDADARGAWAGGLAAGQTEARAVCAARDLTNLPGNRLTPEAMAAEARELAWRFGFECRVYDENDAAAEGMGGLLAVGQGSVNPPRMIVLRYQGNPDSKETLGLVGKGVTFDTGGISLKKPDDMDEMISDMGGAATVLGVMHAVGEWKPQINVVAVIPAAENMPSGSAFKPGDVIATYSGRTVEVLNTDAEGRIVLADGLTTACKWGATRLIDVATLTGAVMVALGDITTGAISNEETYLNELLAAAERAGEYVWPLPSHPEYKRLLKSVAADLKNHGGTQYGAAIFAGLFVGTFAEERPWIHLDIGGTAWRWHDETLNRKGGTGAMVLTLLEFIRSM